MKKLLILLLLPTTIFAQLNVKVDSTNILIGDQINFSIQAELSDGDSLPHFTNAIGALEIVSKSLVDSIKTYEGWQVTQSYILTVWDSGVYYLPSIQFKSFISDSIAIMVNTIEMAEDAELKDIKAPKHTPISFEELSPYLLALLILTLLIYTIRWFIKNSDKTPTDIKNVEKEIPAYVIAFKELEKLNAKKLWQENHVKEYYSELSEIIRTYIENGIGTPAMEIPTNEILFQLNQKGINTTKLKELLTRSDLAKFAKAKPLQIENEESLKIGHDFIHQTKPQKEIDDVE
ncbi:MAG: hypothetical protein CMD38_01200 [Flavobacteriales bacterium]|nr:hypothetical protein [Flavobacteriales bacterium]